MLRLSSPHSAFSMLRKCRYLAPDADGEAIVKFVADGGSHAWSGNWWASQSVVIMAGLRESQRISRYLSTLGCWWNHMSHCRLSVPTKLIDEKTTCVAIKESPLKCLVMLLRARCGRRGRRTSLR